MINDMRFLLFRNIYYKYIKANRYPLYRKRKLDRAAASLKNRNAGETCFVIGNGPSLTTEDLDKLAVLKVKSFASNSIYKLFGNTAWRPDYYVFQDQQVIDGLAGQFGRLIGECGKMVIRRDVYRQLPKDLVNNPKLVMPRLVMHIRRDRYYDFSEDISKYACDGCTVTYFMLQLAYYMGFKRIYLLGVDHNMPVVYDEHDRVVVVSQERQHCFEDDKNITLNPGRILESTYAYQSAKEFLENRGIEIYNATRGGKLEIFPRADIDGVFRNMEMKRGKG